MLSKNDNREINKTDENIPFDYLKKWNRMEKKINFQQEDLIEQIENIIQNLQNIKIFLEKAY